MSVNLSKSFSNDLDLWIKGTNKLNILMFLTHCFPYQVTEGDLRNLVYCDFADPKSESRHYVQVRFNNHWSSAFFKKACFMFTKISLTFFII